MSRARSASKKPARRRRARRESGPGVVRKRQRTTLGYAQDAGHPGGLQDLRAKTETEAEHDVWKRHG